jgi:hypothetical protein
MQNEDFIPDVAISISGYYSDYLFSSFRCSSIPIRKLVRAHAKENIERRSNLSIEDFKRQYAMPNKPVILTDIVSKWPAFRKWNREYLIQHSGNRPYQAEAVQINFKEYVSYLTQCKSSSGCFEESPLYLFDKNFANLSQFADDFEVPKYFSDDLFQVLGNQRPDYQWLIVGPERSGSTFHVDPNSTSAWNAILKGSKKWILFPPHVIPPGVYPSKDGSEVKKNQKCTTRVIKC